MTCSPHDAACLEDVFGKFSINYNKAVNTLKFWSNADTEFGRLIRSLLLSDYKLSSWTHTMQIIEADETDAISVCRWMAIVKRHFESANLLFFNIDGCPRMVFAKESQIVWKKNHTLFLGDNLLWTGVQIEQLHTTAQFVQSVHKKHQQDLIVNLSCLNAAYGPSLAIKHVENRAYFDDTVVEQFIKRQFCYGISVQTSKEIQDATNASTE